MTGEPRGRVSELEQDNARLEQQLGEARALADTNYAQYAESARQHADMMSLYVASQRLHESLDREDVLAAIQEIVINLIGSEELAVFELEENGTSLRLVNSFGIDTEPWRTLPLQPGPLADSIRAGRAWVAETAGTGRLTACVPLMVGGRTLGLVAVFRLLPQKAQIQQVDRDLLDVLRAHGGTALFCTGLAGPARRP